MRNLRELIDEATELMREYGTDLWHPGASKGHVPPKAQHKQCPSGTVRKHRPDGSSSCVALRGRRAY